MFFLSSLILPVVFASGHIPAVHRTTKRGGDKFSFFQPGRGACGGHNTNSDWIVALNTCQWDNGANCNKEITINFGGKTAKATIVDKVYRLYMYCSAPSPLHSAWSVFTMVSISPKVSSNISRQEI
ncbi:hypothetical protein B0H10DRAFT_2061665 [Mycena sp. CBHHK59/15]|nr:hypothetical protein B0H10DRAFT_2061665 [Mycena sp. CBHHK59/15]